MMGDYAADKSDRDLFDNALIRMVEDWSVDTMRAQIAEASAQEVTLPSRRSGARTRNGASLADQRGAINAHMSEAELLAAILELAAARGWRVYHPLPARVRKRGIETWRTQAQGHGVGWPDVFLVRGELALAWELKGPRGVLSPEQADWGSDLVGAGISFRVVYPSDWTSGRVEEWLA